MNLKSLSFIAYMGIYAVTYYGILNVFIITGFVFIYFLLHCLCSALAQYGNYTTKTLLVSNTIQYRERLALNTCQVQRFYMCTGYRDGEYGWDASYFPSKRKSWTWLSN